MHFSTPTVPGKIRSYLNGLKAISKASGIPFRKCSPFWLISSRKCSHLFYVHFLCKGVIPLFAACLLKCVYPVADFRLLIRNINESSVRRPNRPPCYLPSHLKHLWIYNFGDCMTFRHISILFGSISMGRFEWSPFELFINWAYGDSKCGFRCIGFKFQIFEWLNFSSVFYDCFV